MVTLFIYLFIYSGNKVAFLLKNNGGSKLQVYLDFAVFFFLFLLSLLSFFLLLF